MVFSIPILKKMRLRFFVRKWIFISGSINRILLRNVIFLGACLTLVMLPGSDILGAELKPDTIEAWKRYQSLTEQRIEKELSSGEGYLVQDFLPEKEREECNHEIAEGGFCILQMQTKTPEGKKIKVPDGLIHHWMGSIRVPGARLNELLEWIQNYDEHQKYFDEVEKSRLLKHNGNTFDIFYRLRRKKFITVYYNTEHEVFYRLQDATHVSSASHTTKIAELKDAGTPEEAEEPIGNDSGYMWRLNSYWRFHQVDDDVVMSCESISLSRSIPWPVSLFIRGIVNSVPRESLESTLNGIRDGFKKSKTAEKTNRKGESPPAE